MGLGRCVEGEVALVVNSECTASHGGARMAGIFISYRRDDAGMEAGFLKYALKGKFGDDQVFSE
jgi:hypothetical protein